MNREWMHWMKRDEWPQAAGYVFLPGALMDVAEAIGGDDFAIFSLAYRLSMNFEPERSEVALDVLAGFLISGSIQIYGRTADGSYSPVRASYLKGLSVDALRLIMRGAMLSAGDHDGPIDLFVKREPLSVLCQALTTGSSLRHHNVGKTATSNPARSFKKKPGPRPKYDWDRMLADLDNICVGPGGLRSAGLTSKAEVTRWAEAWFLDRRVDPPATSALWERTKVLREKYLPKG